MSKRHKFLVTSLGLSLGFFGITFLNNEDRFLGIGILTVASLIAFIWCLRDRLGKNATLTSLVTPPLFTLGVGLFWFLLPSTFYARLPVIFLYGAGIYSMVSTSNIFTVSVQKKIALARAARGVSFVLSLFTAFLLYDAILSLRITTFATSALVFIASMPIFIQGLWVSRLTKELGRETIIYSLVFGYVMGVWALMLFFWPVSVVVGALFLTVGVYVLLGLGQARLEGRLFKQTVYEYLAVGIIVFVTMVLVTNWRG